MADQVVWLQDVSLEVFRPGFIQGEGDSRQMQLQVSKQSAPLSNKEDIRVDMRLLCTIHVENQEAVIADISAASLTQKAHFDESKADVEEKIYHYIRDALGGLLQMAHYSPPLPEHLSQIK